jgi:uncharacterized protein with FMN-binding domain
MRRLLLALAGTAAGLAAVLSFKTQGSAATSGTVAAPETGTQGTTSASAPVSTGNSTSTGTSTKSGGSAAAAQQGGGTAAAAGAKVLTGTVDNTPYGPMQVQVTMEGSKIAGVKVLQQTNTGSLSQQIDANAIPQLTKETLTAQSARIDAVSGASYTSSGYIKSLQSALDQAKA